MYVRKVGVCLKPGSLAEFSRLMEFEILPWLREQEGFQDLLTLAEPDGCQVATLTFWDHDGNASVCEACSRQAVETLERMLDGVPYVKTFDVIGSTIPKFAPACQPGTDGLVREDGSDSRSFRVV